MIRVAGLWEIGWTTPYTEYDDWSHMLRDFGVEDWIMVPVSGLRRGTSSILSERNDFADVIDEARDRRVTIVYIDEAGEACLTPTCSDHPYFEYPDGDVLYVFGKSGQSPFRDYAVPGEASVRIHTPNERAGMWAHQAAAVVFFDRYVRS